MNSIVITKKVILRAAPTPPFVGTTIVIDTTLSSLETPQYGLYAATLAEGSNGVDVDWGDGTAERVTAISQLVHTYVKPGVYTIRLSDDIDTLQAAGSPSTCDYSAKYSPMVTQLASNAQRLAQLGAYAFTNSLNMAMLSLSTARITTLSSNVFKGAVLLTGRVDFPYVVTWKGKVSLQPFENCASLREIHFAKANESAIKAWNCYQRDPQLGAVKASIIFDL